MRLLGPLLFLSFSAFAEAPRLALAKDFANPTVIGVKRAEGGAMGVANFISSCKTATATSMVSVAPVAVLELSEDVAHLQLSATNGDVIVARNGGSSVCGETTLVLAPAAKGLVELFLVTAVGVDAEAVGKIRILDLDRPRVLPEPVKTVRVAAKAPVVLEGELAPMPAVLPDLQLEVPEALAGLKWRLYGGAAEVWISSLVGEKNPAVKVGDSIAPGRYAVWIRGASPEAHGGYKVVAVPAGVELEPLQFFSKPGADVTIERRALTVFMPGLDPKALEGFSKSALELRKRAFTELPGEFFVFAAADGEVLLPLAVAAGEAMVIAADGATFSMAVSELALEPSAAGPLVRAPRSELVEKLSIEDLGGSEKDPRVKALEKLRVKTAACMAKHSAKPDVAKRCNAAKVTKAEAKLRAALAKAYAKKRAVELAAVEKHVKSVLVSSAD